MVFSLLLLGFLGALLFSPFSRLNFKIFKNYFLLRKFILLKGFWGFGEKGKPPITFLYAIGAPLIHASIALGLCKLLGLPMGDTILLMVLAASASYIAVPAVLRHALPEVNPALYMGMSLGITFPFNIILGIPLYTYIVGLTY